MAPTLNTPLDRDLREPELLLIFGSDHGQRIFDNAMNIPVEKLTNF